MTRSEMMKRIGKWIGIALGAALIMGLLFILSRPIAPYSAAEVRRLTTLLNEDAAITTPHRSLLTDEERKFHTALLAKVESGTPLSLAESRQYRALFQAALRRNRSRLALFDSNLTVMTDLRMHDPNNVGGQGIAHDHDHHDASARSNFDDMARSLDAIGRSHGIFGSVVRIRNANAAYKNLTDIILHLGTAPQTISVDHQRCAAALCATPLGADFEAMLAAYKAAQFTPVNSPAYARDVGRALAAYDRLVLAVQGRINTDLSPLERRLAGRWLAPQTLSPSPDPAQRVRFPR